MLLKDRLYAHALTVGFSDIGICRPDSTPETAERLASFVDAGYHGQMTWMAERMNWRGSAAALWPDAKSIIMLAERYTPDHDPLAILDQPDCAGISVYAQGRDYHDIVKKRLKVLGRWLIDQQPDAQIKVFVDTAPVMEKPLAAAAGLGWQGKHTNLVSRNLGSWFFLGAIFTTVELDADQAEVDHCGSCRACLDICPTDAFAAPYHLDARKCISYLTIEHKGPIPEDLRAKIGNRIYGCDDCLAVCPWNKFAQSGRDVRLAAREDLLAPPLLELAALDDATFRTKFSGSPVKRIGRDRFIRNVLYAIGNSGDADLVAAVQPHLSDPDPTVAEAAVWAMAQIQKA